MEDGNGSNTGSPVGGAHTPTGTLPVAVGLVQLVRESEGFDPRILRGREWTILLIAIIVISGVFNSISTWNTEQETKQERARTERLSGERERRAQQERQEIVGAIKHIETALERQHDPNLTPLEALNEIGNEVQALREQALKLEKELEGVRNYSDIAYMDLTGMAFVGRGSVSIETDIAKAMKGGYKLTEGGIFFEAQCHENGIEILQNVAKTFPYFPFAHAWIASCLVQAGNPEWRIHAEKARGIIHLTKWPGAPIL